MKKLVTGATGFIGSVIARELIREGEEVKVLIRRTSNTRNIDDLDVEDVARGHVLAAKKGRLGERYLLGNRNITVHDYLKLIADIAGVKAPAIKLPYHLALAFGYRFELDASITRKPPVVTASEVRIGRMTEWYDCSKAINELGLPQTPIELTIHKALNWFGEHGYLQKT